MLASCLLLLAGLLLNATKVLQAGLITLIATPVAVLLLVTAGFFRKRDHSFALISIGVLFLMVVSLVLAFR
jgi:uncharacterized membrane protein